ncbi:hypothetical protein MTR62_21070, partial [Novosphingobium sp. 1949]|nr:hypothetical protein [Novosphingobium organovorum]
MNAFRSNQGLSPSRLRLRRLARLPVVSAVAVALLAGTAAPVFAQDNTDARLRKVESEVRALQRKVFPGGDGTFFEPQITPPAAGATPAPVQTPTSTPLTDLLTRMDAVETQMARLTAQVEQNSNRLSELEARVSANTQAMAQQPPATPAPETSAQSNLEAMRGTPATPPSAPSPRAAA